MSHQVFRLKQQTFGKQLFKTQATYCRVQRERVSIYVHVHLHVHLHLHVGVHVGVHVGEHVGVHVYM